MVGLYHDLRNMVQCADIYFNASLHRTESRGWHYREDFPVRDDQNWLKWVIVRQEDGRMQVLTEDIPVERYKSKPNGQARDRV
jgi:succinate dehydrogenase/fumarate reductase flavoprotein subunit